MPPRFHFFSDLAPALRSFSNSFSFILSSSSEPTYFPSAYCALAYSTLSSFVYGDTGISPMKLR